MSGRAINLENVKLYCRPVDSDYLEVPAELLRPGTLSPVAALAYIGRVVRAHGREWVIMEVDVDFMVFLCQLS